LDRLIDWPGRERFLAALGMTRSDHIDHCIVDAVETGDTETIEELNKAIEMLMK
jgi:DNA-binding FrmR family transcriptional regulator